MSGWGDNLQKKNPKAGWGNDEEAPSSMPAKKNIWDEDIQELDIPELEGDDIAGAGDAAPVPAALQNKMLALAELDSSHMHNVPSIIEEGVDVSLLTSVIRPIADLIEADIPWDYLSLQTEIGQMYREKIAESEEVPVVKPPVS